MFARALTIFALLSAAAAQLSLSQPCTQALTTIATSADANACLTPSPLIPILTNSNISIVEPINNWLTSLCAAPACSNNTLAAIVTNVTAGCSTELSLAGFQSGDTSAVTALIQKYYPDVRNIVCLKDGNTNCVTQTLTNIQDIVGPLTVQTTLALFSGNSNLTELPSNVTCTSCAKAAYNIVNAEVPGFLGANSEDLQAVCGASFTDGANPSGITQSASDKAPVDTKNSGAFTLGALTGATSLVAISSMFALLA
ncbi:hypothetical protein DXG03_005774 [Asterophora parasitica]|uniref:Uncharacterized protein n=1 Tax=Asterophora parasitica TaxID=117018 RepID=A0A9P7K8J8_9AGAR|nr:hypothetical protein DXG03_005774 [Asterophora parasitica]